jgi:predicted Kef-type K+ transport protein
MKDSTSFFPVTLIAVSVAFIFRVFAVRQHWPQIVPYVAPAAGPLINERPAKKPG